MRPIAIAVVLAGLSGYSASVSFAADLPEPVFRAAPLPASALSWTGFYIGVGIGGGKDLVKGAVTAATNNGVNILCVPGNGPCTGTNLDSWGFRASSYLGYNWQFSPVWVAGLEGDFGLGKHNKALPGAIFPGGNFPFPLTRRDDSFSFESTWDASVRARLGYLFTPSTLLYVTGGGKMLHIESTSHCGVLSDCLPGQFVTLLAPANISHSGTMIGWTVGGGVETMLMPNWLLRAEYRYADLGTKTFTDIRVTPAGPTTQLATYSLGVTTHTAFVGLAYKF